MGSEERGGVRAPGTGGRSPGESPVGEAELGDGATEPPREWNDARRLGPTVAELGVWATGAGGVPRVRNLAKPLQESSGAGRRQAASGKESRVGGRRCAEASAEPAGKEGSGEGAAAAAVAAVEYSVPKGRGKGSNRGARGGGGG